jgi:hypothetical protein
MNKGTYKLNLPKSTGHALDLEEENRELSQPYFNKVHPFSFQLKRNLAHALFMNKIW